MHRQNSCSMGPSKMREMDRQINEYRIREQKIVEQQCIYGFFIKFSRNSHFVLYIFESNSGIGIYWLVGGQQKHEKKQRPVEQEIKITNDTYTLKHAPLQKWRRIFLTQVSDEEIYKA